MGVGDIIHKLLLDVGVDISASAAYTVFSLLMGVIVVAGKSYIDKIKSRPVFIHHDGGDAVYCYRLFV
ncbi:hypothetical protein O9993_17175 [Vibrio lentus]|nr:hypothetical protein [Vibrio lentus]